MISCLIENTENKNDWFRMIYYTPQVGVGTVPLGYADEQFLVNDRDRLLLNWILNHATQLLARKQLKYFRY